MSISVGNQVEVYAKMGGSSCHSFWRFLNLHFFLYKCIRYIVNTYYVNMQQLQKETVCTDSIIP